MRKLSRWERGFLTLIPMFVYTAWVSYHIADITAPRLLLVEVFSALGLMLSVTWGIHRYFKRMDDDARKQNPL